MKAIGLTRHSWLQTAAMISMVAVTGIPAPLSTRAQELVINCSTSAGGSLRVEIQEASGQPIPGFTLGESVPFVGDAIEQPLAWRRETAEPTRDLAHFAGRPVRLRFELVDADLYAIQFRSAAASRRASGETKSHEEIR